MENRMAKPNPILATVNDQTASAVDVIPAVQSDTVDLDTPGRAFLCGGAGDIRIITFNGEDRTFPVAANQIVPVYVRRVFTTSTTATGIHILV